MKVAERRLRNKLSKLIGRRRAITRRLKEIDDALAELGQLGAQPQNIAGGLTSQPFASHLGGGLSHLA